MSSIKTVSTNTFYYTISSLLLRASSLIFFPIFSSYLVKSDYGILSIVQSLVIIISVIGGLGLNYALTRFIYIKSTSNKNDHSKIIFTTLISSLFCQLSIVIILLVLGPYLLNSIMNDIPFYPYIFIGLITIPINTIIDIARIYFKATHEGRKAFILDMSFYSMNIIFNVLFVIGFGFNVLGILLGIFVNTILFSLILIFSFYRKFNYSYDKKLILEILKYSIPLIPFIILNMVFESVDKFFLNSQVGVDESGIYYIALTFAAIFSSLKESLISAITPWIYKKISSDKNKVSQVLNLTVIIIGFVGIVVSFLSNDILTILSSNSEFIVASKYIPLSIVGFYIIFLGQLFNIQTYYFGKYSRYLFVATFIGIIVEIVSCYFLVPELKILGASLSRIIAFFVQTLLFLYFSKMERESAGLYNYSFLFFSLIFISGVIILPFFIELKFHIFINIMFKSMILLFFLSFILFIFRREFKLFYEVIKNK